MFSKKFRMKYHHHVSTAVTKPRRRVVLTSVQMLLIVSLLLSIALLPPMTRNARAADPACPNDTMITTLPVGLNFSGSAAGCLDTGLTTVMPDAGSSTTLKYASSLIDLSGGLLKITSTRGDPYQEHNSQQNALAVRFDAMGAFEIKTTLKVPFGMTENYDSAGIWFGLNEDNYVKLGSTAHNGQKLELAIEEAGTFAGTGRQVYTSINYGTIATTLSLILKVVPDAAKVEAFYSIDGGALQSAGTLYTLPIAFSTSASYGGIIQTHVGNSTSFVANYDSFAISPVNQDGTVIPAMPTGLTATGSTNQINVDWNDVSNAIGYNVYRDTDSTINMSGTPLNGSTLLTTSSFIDRSVTPGTTYYYVVTAVNNAGSSSPTDPVSAVASSGVACTTSTKPTLLNFSGAIADTYAGSGFNCYMPGSVAPSSTNTGLTLSGFNSHLVVASTNGDINASNTTQNNALALRFANTASYAVKVRIKGPFSAATAFQAAGVFLALDANNYAKLVIGQGSSGARVQFGIETNGTFSSLPDVSFNLSELDTDNEAVDLWLVRKSDGKV